MILIVTDGDYSDHEIFEVLYRANQLSEAETKALNARFEAFKEWRARGHITHRPSPEPEIAGQDPRRGDHWASVLVAEFGFVRIPYTEVDLSEGGPHMDHLVPTTERPESSR